MTRRIFCKVLLVVVAIFGLLVLSGVLSAQGNRDWAFEHVQEVQERNTNRLMAIEGVVGTAIGFNPNARLSVVVLLETPGVGGIPQKLEGIPVHRVVTGEIYALDPPVGKGPPEGKGPKEPKEEVDPTGWFERPVPIGVSTGHPYITAGTIGCRVTDGTVYALSNKHVYAPDGANIDDDVLQPGALDGGGTDPKRDDVIGTLADFEEILFYDPDKPPDPVPTNTIDAAIAEIIIDIDEETAVEIPRVDNATPSDGYETPKSTTATAYIGQKVQKYGRTTGLTKGRVYAINATVNVDYGASGIARFVGQIMISPGGFSAGGDSGSLVVLDGKGRNRADDRRPVGLLFAGNPLYTFANPIDLVLTRFGVIVDGE